MVAEQRDEFDLTMAWQFGLVPLIVTSADLQFRLNAYLSLYLHDKVQAEALVRNTGHFSKFLESITFSQGAILNVSEVAGEAKVSRKTIEGFIEILEGLLLAFRSPLFSKRAKRLLIKYEKFYYFDIGVFHSVRPKGSLGRPEEIESIALEGLIVQ